MENEVTLNLDVYNLYPPQVRAMTGSPGAILRNRGTVQKSTGGDTVVDWAYADLGITRQPASGRLLFTGPSIGSAVGTAGSAGPAPAEYRGGFNAASPGVTSCAAADPVSCISGDFYENLDDLSISGRGRPLSVRRSYSAQAAEQEGLPSAPAAGPARLGPWRTHPYASRLEIVQGFVTLHGPPERSDRHIQGRYQRGVLGRRSRQGASGPNGGRVRADYKDQTKDVFDDTGRLRRQLDANGYATTISYDADGRIEHVTDEAARRLTYVHDTHGRIASITDPAGRLVDYDYDANGDLTRVVDVAGKAWSYGYDSRHRIMSMRDPRGHETTNVYDAESRVVRQTDASGGVTRFAYTASSTTVTNQRGHQTRYEVSGGLISRVVRGVGTAT